MKLQEAKDPGGRETPTRNYREMYTRNWLEMKRQEAKDPKELDDAKEAKEANNNMCKHVVQ